MSETLRGVDHQRTKTQGRSQGVAQAGLDSLVFKANHCQWQFSCDILCDNPDDAASLQISTVPHP